MKKISKMIAGFVLSAVGCVGLVGCSSENESAIRLVSGQYVKSEVSFVNNSDLTIQENGNVYLVSGTASVLSAEQAGVVAGETGGAYIIIELDFKAGATISSTYFTDTYTNNTAEADVLQFVLVLSGDNSSSSTGTFTITLSGDSKTYTLDTSSVTLPTTETQTPTTEPEDDPEDETEELAPEDEEEETPADTEDETNTPVEEEDDTTPEQQIPKED